MRKIIVFALFCLPGALCAQGLNKADLNEMPGVRAQEEKAVSPVPRPDADGIMADLSATLRLSSKQEKRIASAIKKEASRFDKMLKEYEKCVEEEKAWRYKANDARYEMVRLNRSIPDVIRDYLDDEQRENFDALVAEKRRRAAAKAAAETRKPAAKKPAAKPVRKKRLIRRKKSASPRRPAARPVRKPAPKPAETLPAAEPAIGSYP